MNNIMEEYERKTNEFLYNAYGRVLDQLVGPFLTEEEAHVQKVCLHSIAQTYVINMLEVMFNNTDQQRTFFEEELDGLWASYDSEEFAKRSGITINQGKFVLRRTKETILENLFNDPVILSRDDKLYTIQRTLVGLHVKAH